MCVRRTTRGTRNVSINTSRVGRVRHIATFLILLSTFTPGRIFFLCCGGFLFLPQIRHQRWAARKTMRKHQMRRRLGSMGISVLALGLEPFVSFKEFRSAFVTKIGTGVLAAEIQSTWELPGVNNSINRCYDVVKSVACENDRLRIKFN